MIDNFDIGSMIHGLMGGFILGLIVGGMATHIVSKFFRDMQGDIDEKELSDKIDEG